VVITGRNQATLDGSAEKLGAANIAIRADAQPHEMQKVFEDVKARFGRLDIFVANAGIGEHQPLGAIKEEQFDQVIATNLRGVFFAVQSAISLMEPGSSIVIIGSTGSVAPPAGMSVGRFSERDFASGFLCE
jgi:NAD(P)-dependent dehydrogenase (short-subunit alcohol dehydrogenase family)